MKRKHKIIISKKDASVLGIMDDIAPYLKLGTVNVQRVSNIEFNNEKQKYEVILTHNNDIPIETQSKNDAYDQEVGYVSEKLKDLGAIHFKKNEEGSSN
jgi:hypothetical protein